MPRNATTKRRLAAILAVDVVGYTRLMAQDEPAPMRGCGRSAVSRSTRR
jgi:class 3 adenylate cyclase